MAPNSSTIARVAVLLGLATLLIIGFQNCQNGGNSMMSLQSCNIGDCGPGDPGPENVNDENLQTQISDGGTGILQMNKNDTSFSFYATCYYNGFVAPKVHATISRGAQLVEGDFPCSSATVLISFSGMNTAFGLPTQTADATVFVEAQGYDSDSVLHHGGTDSATLQFVSSVVVPPPPGASPTITISSLYRGGTDGKGIALYAMATSFTPDQYVSMTVQYQVGGNTYTVNPPQARANGSGFVQLSALLTQGAAELWKASNVNLHVKMAGGNETDSNVYSYGGDTTALRLIRIYTCAVTSNGVELYTTFLKPQNVPGRTVQIKIRNVSTGNQWYTFDRTVGGLAADGGYNFVLENSLAGLDGAPNDKYIIRASLGNNWSTAYYLNGSCFPVDSSF